VTSEEMMNDEKDDGFALITYHSSLITPSRALLV
jgi:hypothetical protein